MLVGEFNLFHSSMPLGHPLPGETVVTIIRRHWIIFFLSIVLHLLLVLIPFPVLWFLHTYLPSLFTESSLSWTLLVLTTSTYVLLMILMTYVRFIDIYLDVWVVTNKRVLNIEQLGMFSRTESEHTFDKIQDITVEVSGVISTLFNFGDLHVQTAGEKVRFIFKSAPEPYLLKKKLTELVERTSSSSSSLNY